MTLGEPVRLLKSVRPSEANSMLRGTHHGLPQPQPPKGMPKPDETDGWAFAGDVNFAGPGWSGPFRTRPRNHFDFASKLHDLAYCVNDLEIKMNPFFKRDPISLSRKAKADSIFRLMNRHTGTSGFSIKLLNWGANLIFDGKDQDDFVAGDGFINPLTHSSVVFLLSDPAAYLMIPYERLPRHLQPKTRKGKPDYMTATRYDHSPGWVSWAKTAYAKVWNDLAAITDAAGKPRPRLTDDKDAKKDAPKVVVGPLTKAGIPA